MSVVISEFNKLSNFSLFRERFRVASVSEQLRNKRVQTLELQIVSLSQENLNNLNSSENYADSFCT
jgi:hypothetical protein